jgi:hypothetical protein
MALSKHSQNFEFVFLLAVQHIKMMKKQISCTGKQCNHRSASDSIWVRQLQTKFKRTFLLNLDPRLAVIGNLRNPEFHAKKLSKLLQIYM